MRGDKNLQEKWDAVPKAGKLSEDISFRLWKNIKHGIQPQKSHSSKIWWAAASILFIISTFFIIKFIPQNNIQISTSKGEIKVIRLSDGSKIWLNENSRFTYPEKFVGDQRNVDLSGEAFFEVAKDPKHPFIITSGNLKTKVLGTSFTVYTAEKHEAYVSVVTGKVNVSNVQTDNEIDLIPGEKVSFSAYKNNIRLSKVKAEAPVWKNNLLDIEDKNLAEISLELEKKYHVKIILEGQNLAQEKLNGVLDLRNPLQDHLNTLTFTLNAKTEIHNDIIYIKK